jgi:SAM-dependent methyltransferase
VSEPYYRADLAFIHGEGFGFHAARCAPGVLGLLEPVREAGGLVLEIGAGTGALTRALVGAGHRVIVTDASPAMLELAAAAVPGAERIDQLTLPDDPLPQVDAIVGVGHALNYLADLAAVERALVAIAGALRPGGVLAVDVCDLAWGRARADAPAISRLEDDWALITRFSLPRADLYVREMTTFVRTVDGSWRRDDERHDNVLVDVAQLPGLLAGLGVDARVGTSFGDEDLPPGLVTLIGRRDV